MAYTASELQQRGYYFDGATQMWINPATKNTISATEVDAGGTAAGAMSPPNFGEQVEQKITGNATSQIANQVVPQTQVADSSMNAPVPGINTTKANQSAQMAPDITPKSDSMAGITEAAPVAGSMISPGVGTVIGAGIGAIGSAMEGGGEESGLQKEQEEQVRLQNELTKMGRAAGETEALPVRTKYPVLSGLPSGPLRAPQRAAWALTYGLGPDAKKPENKNLDYLRTAPATAQSVQAAKLQRMQAAENRLRIAKMVIYPLALGALLL